MIDRNYTEAETLVKLENLSLQFGEKKIIHNISAEVKDIIRPGLSQGQIVGLLGPSGIGKTQLSKMMAGLVQPTSGRVLVENKPISPGLVGYVTQSYPLFKHRTVHGNLSVASRDQKKIGEFLERFGLSDKKESFPSELSGGQRQRVAIIQQLLCSEHYLILDEPFTGLDPLMKDKVCDLIRQVSLLNEKNTIFIVAHDISALLAVSDTLWILGRTDQGSTIKHKIDLIANGIAWDPKNHKLDKFHSLQQEIKQMFYDL